MLRSRTTALALALAGLVPLTTVAGGSAEATTSAARSTSRVSLLSASFDSAPTGQMTPSTFKQTLTGDTTSYHLDDSYVVKTTATDRSYRVDLEKDTVYGNPTGNHGVVSVIPLKRAVDNACLRYRVRFDSNFDWSMGGKLPGLSGVAPGVTPSLPSGGGNPGDKGWSGRMMWRTAKSLPPSVAPLAKPAMATSYMYGPKQTDYYGDVVPWKVSFQPGKWATVRECYRMNTVGKADGVLRTWFNGQRALNITNYVYRTRTDVHITHLMWSVFRGGSTMDWAGSHDDSIDFDNVRVTTRS